MKIRKGRVSGNGYRVSQNRVDVCYKKKIRLPYDVRECAMKILAAEGAGKSAINMVFTDDKFIKMMNTEYRNKNKATDVITFENGGNSGDIYISVDTAAKNADEFGVTLPQETARLITHGVLHALGYDHLAAAEERIMMRKTEKYMKFFKVRVRG